jgi:hypothetical protein
MIQGRGKTVGLAGKREVPLSSRRNPVQTTPSDVQYLMVQRKFGSHVWRKINHFVFDTLFVLMLLLSDGSVNVTFKIRRHRNGSFRNVSAICTLPCLLGRKSV